MDNATKKLTELLKEKMSECFSYQELAEVLIAAGVIVPPCKMGEKLFWVLHQRPKSTYPKYYLIRESRLTFGNLERVLANFGNDCFLTREEAEKALAERREKSNG